jgi:hypothetical protein
MMPGGQLLLAKGGGEPVRILLDGIPYKAQLVADSVEGLPAGVEVMVLLEDVGSPAPDPNNTLPYFAAGSITQARDTKDRHPTTGERVFVLVSPDEIAGHTQPT